MTCLVCGFRFKARRVVRAKIARLHWQDDGIPLMTAKLACDECGEFWCIQLWGFALMGREVAA